MQKLWGARFNNAGSELLDEFNASLPFDKNLWQEDIQGSIEHVKMLQTINVLSSSERDLIIKGLEEIKGDIQNDKFDFDIKHEDIHLCIESNLIKKIGDVGKKLHTARSRNDQVALDFKMYCLKENDIIKDELLHLMRTLLELAKNHIFTIMPGFTHLQHAQPISFSFYVLCYCSNFMRDILRLKNTKDINLDCPLGSAALAGSTYKNERDNLAKNLGFRESSINAMDSVSSRDFALDLLYNIAMIFMHISRFAEELIIFSSQEFNFISFSDEFSTGSSIMPQKKNPDVAELLRGKSGRSYGNLMALLTVMKGLPLAYNKDMQEDKECVFDSINNVKISLKILNASLKTLTINKDIMLKACKSGHLVATDLADFLVKRFNVPFRESYGIIGECIKKLDEIKVDLSDASVDFLLDIIKTRVKIDEKISINDIKKDLLDSINPISSMQRRDSKGGTSPESVMVQIDIFEDFLKNN